MSMEVDQLQRSFLEYANVLFREGFLDGQFSQLQLLQDESNPDFVGEVVSLFFEDSQRLLNDLTIALYAQFYDEIAAKKVRRLNRVQAQLGHIASVWDQQKVDFKKIDAYVHQLKGSSSSIGAQRVKNACIAFRNLCEEQNVEACKMCLDQVKQEYLLVKTKLESLLQLQQQIVGAGGVIQF